MMSLYYCQKRMGAFVVCIPVSLAIHLCAYLIVCVPVIFVRLYRCNQVYVCMFVSLSDCISIRLSMSLSQYLPTIEVVKRQNI